MSQYPNEIFTPRPKENRAGVVYDPSKKTVAFVEDMQAVENEIIALEEGLNTMSVNTSAGRVIPADAIFTPTSFLEALNRYPEKLQQFSAAYLELEDGPNYVVDVNARSNVLYLLCAWSPSILVKVVYGDEPVITQLELPEGFNSAVRFTIHDTDMYIVCNGDTVKVAKVDLTTFEITETYEAPSGYIDPTVIIYNGGVIQVLCSASPGKIIVLSADDLSQIALATMGPGQNLPHCALKIYEKIYVGFLLSPGRVDKMPGGGGPPEASYVADSGLNQVSCLTTDGSFLYVGFYDDEGHVVKLSLDDLSVQGTLTCGISDTFVTDIMYDGHNIYALIDGSPGKVCKIDQENMEVISTYTMATGNNNPSRIIRWVDQFIVSLRTLPGKLLMKIFADVDQDGI